MSVKIKEARESIGMSQTELARLMDVTQGAVCQWESGLSNPGISKLKKLAKVLCTTVDNLLPEERAG